jgi:hypothetical protein
MTDVAQGRVQRDTPERLAARARLVAQYSWPAVTRGLQQLIAGRSSAAFAPVDLAVAA